jgi:D-alanine-D-alanine ligase-like ATP-grasp enzyme
VTFLEDRRKLLLEAEAYDTEPQLEDTDQVLKEAERMGRKEEEGSGEMEEEKEEKKETPLHVKAVKEVSVVLD